MHFSIDGMIGESSLLFSKSLEGVSELTLDLSKMTYINSVGVKNWILWTNKIPRTCKVRLINSPFVIASQASMVFGFQPKNMTIESVRIPYSCESCRIEIIRLAHRGQDYEYATKELPEKLNFPLELPCPKCPEKLLEPDFQIEKTFNFLKSVQL